jgi:hypothetical protein
MGCRRRHFGLPGIDRSGGAGYFCLNQSSRRTRSFSACGRRWCGHKSAPDEGSPSAAQLQFFARVKQKPLTRRTLRVRRPLPQGERYEVWRALGKRKVFPGRKPRKTFRSTNSSSRGVPFAAHDRSETLPRSKGKVRGSVGRNVVPISWFQLLLPVVAAPIFGNGRLAAIATGRNDGLERDGSGAFKAEGCWFTSSLQAGRRSGSRETRPSLPLAVLGFRRVQPETALLPAPFQCTTRGSAHFDWRLAGATRTGTAGVGNLLAIQTNAS